MFIRPTSAHYTYRPAASPVRDRRAYKDLPASFYTGVQPDFDLGVSRDYTDEDFGFLAPNTNNLSAEARYRRALEEARAAKEELRVEAEEARLREEAITLQSEIARLRAERAREEARLNQIRLEEARLAQAMRQEARMIQAVKERERRAAEEAQVEARRRELIARRRAALLQQERARAAVRQLFQAPDAPQVARPQPRPQPQPQARPITLADLLERSLTPQEARNVRPQPAAQAPTPAPVPKVQPKTEESPEQVNMKEVYDFIYNLFGPQVVPKQEQTSAPSAPVPVPAPKPQDKGKSKAASEPAFAQAPAHGILKQRLEERLARETEQEMADTARAILNSLRDQHAAPAATSSKVKVENAPRSSSTSSADLKRVPELSGNVAQDVKTQFAAHRRSTSAPATPLERIQSIRTSLTSLRTSFHFPATPDYNNTTGALDYTPANTPLRAYEHALNDLLEQLDGIESEGDDAVRGRRREVVKEVERALEEFDERVRAASPVRSPSTPEPIEAKEEAEEDANVAAEKQEETKRKEQVAVGLQKVEENQVEADTQETSSLPAEATIPAAAHVEPSIVDPAANTNDSADLDAVVEPSETTPSTDGEAVQTATDVSADDALVTVEDSAVPLPASEEFAPVEQPVVVGEQPTAREPAVAEQPHVTEESSTIDHVVADDDSAQAPVFDVAPIETIPTGSALDADTAPPTLDAPTLPSLSDTPALSDEVASSPQPEQRPSESFLTSLSRDHFSFPPAPHHQDTDADELEDSVLIEKEDDRDSVHSWSEVEPESA